MTERIPGNFHYHHRMWRAVFAIANFPIRSDAEHTAASQPPQHRIWIAATLLAIAPLPLHTQVVAAPSPPTVLSASQPRDASLDDYRTHLKNLGAIVEGCSKARDMKSCDPAQVGPDDEVPVADHADGPRRLVRYGWLRVLLSKARDKDAPPKADSKKKPDEETWQDVRPLPPTTTQLLKDAHDRLTHDATQSESAAPAASSHNSQREAMKSVLAGREFADLEEPTAQDSAYEKVGNWLNHLLERAMKASAAAPWLGRALVWGFITAVCVCLVWVLLQLQRRWRVRLIPEDRGLAPGAASAIAWQVWLEDARRAAALGQWREAIHFLYWAAISRLESKRLWPADRARTPREYLALVGPDDSRLAGLTLLTGSFERVWYGGRPAAQVDYQRAEQIASALISGNAQSDGGERS